MAEEFQARTCGENWWIHSIDSTRSVFPLSSTSPCCSVDAGGNYISTRQTTDIIDLKPTKCCAEEKISSTNLVSDSNYLSFVDAQKPQTKRESASGSILIDSTLQMMGFGLTSSTSGNWNQPPLFRCNGRSESNLINSMVQEGTGIDSSSNSQIERDNNWIPKSFSSNQVSNIDTNMKPIMNQEFSLDQLSLSSLSSISSNNRGFPIGSTSYGNPSTLMQSLYDDPNPQPQHSLFTNRPLSYSSKANYDASSNELPPIWSKVSTFYKPTPIAKQYPFGLHFSNNTPFWNASAEALHDIRLGTFASSQSQHQTPNFQHKPNCQNTLLNKLKSEENLDSTAMDKKNVCEPALKRPRIETPPSPTFKVRKEKLGDRVTALQQLVSPFGKTDTASVLHEAIEYIKLLHDQVNVLSTSYMKNGAPIQQQQGCEDDKKESLSKEGAKRDLKSRGLCLVPISSTFPVATETSGDFWTPTFRGALLR